jgi:uncharacterized protein
VAGERPALRRRAGRAPHRLRSILRRIAATALDDTIRELLSTPLTWAVVGCSPSPARDSHGIAGLLKRRGNRIVPVNPLAAGAEIHGERCVASLADLPADAASTSSTSSAARTPPAPTSTRRSIGARAVWMQLGVIDHAAAERARAAGLEVVMDRCPAIEVRRLGL